MDHTMMTMHITGKRETKVTARLYVLTVNIEDITARTGKHLHEGTLT